VLNVLCSIKKSGTAIRTQTKGQGDLSVSIVGGRDHFY